jgi:hypothetical protein
VTAIQKKRSSNRRHRRGVGQLARADSQAFPCTLSLLSATSHKVAAYAVGLDNRRGWNTECLCLPSGDSCLGNHHTRMPTPHLQRIYHLRFSLHVQSGILSRSSTMPLPSLVALPSEILTQVFDYYFSDQRIHIFTPAAIFRLRSSDNSTDEALTELPSDQSYTAISSLALLSKQTYQLTKSRLQTLPIILIGVFANNDPILDVLPPRILQHVTKIVLFDTAISLCAPIQQAVDDSPTPAQPAAPISPSLLTTFPLLKTITLAPLLSPSLKQIYFVRGAMCVLRPPRFPSALAGEGTQSTIRDMLWRR